jgi:hypothetical protein
MDFSFYKDPLITLIFERAYDAISNMNGWKAVSRLNKVYLHDDTDLPKIFDKVNKIINEVNYNNSPTISSGYVISILHYIKKYPYGLEEIRKNEQLHYI